MIKKRSIILIVLMIIIALMLQTSESLAAAAAGGAEGASYSGGGTVRVDVQGNSMAHVHAKNPSIRPIYCMFHGRALSYRDNRYGHFVKWADYNTTTISDPVEPSVGYAFLYANTEGYDINDEGTRKQLQTAVWASRQWGNNSSVLDAGSKEVTTHADGTSTGSGAIGSGPIVGRSYQYGKVWYEILKYAEGGDIFKITPDAAADPTDDNLKIIVDKTNGQYIVGPYKLELTGAAAGASAEAKDILYKEIISKNSSENYGYTLKTKFASYSKLKGINYKSGTKLEILKKDGSRFGSEISFPDFRSSSTNEFYIRFTPSDEYINQVTYDKIELEMQYLKDFSASLTKYTAEKLVVKDPVGTMEAGDSTTVEVGGDAIKVWAVGDGKLYGGKMVVKEINIGDAEDGKKFTSNPKNYGDKHRWEGTAKVEFLFYFVPNQSMVGGEDPDPEGDGGESPGSIIEVKQEGTIDIYSDGEVTAYIEAEEEGEDDETTTTDSDADYWIVKYDGNWHIKPNAWPGGKTYFEYKDFDDFEIEGISIQDLVTIIDNEKGYTKATTTEWIELDSDCKKGKITCTLSNKGINMQLGGNVWQDVDMTKIGSGTGVDGKRSSTAGYQGYLLGKDTNYDSDTNFGGVQVELYDNGSLVASTTTNENGVYRFFGTKATNKLLVSPFHDYTIRFRFNGQLYQQTIYSYGSEDAPWTSEPVSIAKEEDRLGFNDRFDTIESTMNGNGSEGRWNYNVSGWNRAYSIKHKIENSSGNYISYSSKYVDGALTFGDVWDKFIEYATNTENSFTQMERQVTDYQDDWTSTSGSTYSKLDGNAYQYAFDQIGNFLSGYGVSGTEIGYIKTFIWDCLMTSVTQKTYPIYTLFVINNITEGSVSGAGTYDAGLAGTAWASANNLYTRTSDQSRFIDYGITLRETNDVAIQKDVFKVTTIIDGEKEEYNYASKNVKQSSDGWDIELRKNDHYLKTKTVVKKDESTDKEYIAIEQEEEESRFDGSFVHPLEVRRSDYETNFDEGIKNLQVYITYRIAIINEGNYRLYINEVMDYYDADDLTFDGKLNGTKYTNTVYNEYNDDGSVKSQYVNSYIGKDENGTRLNASSLNDLQVSTRGREGRSNRQLKGTNYNYDTVFLEGKNGTTIKSVAGRDYLDTSKDAYQVSGDSYATSNQAFIYVTFKVKNAETTSLENGEIKNKIKLDQSILTGEKKLGKRNIAEINSYTTRYASTDEVYTEGINIGDKAGLIDMDSNPGSLKKKDLRDDTEKGGSIIVESDNTKDRQQDDTDAAPPIRFVLSSNDDTRVFSGIAFEDSRTEYDEGQGTVLGNGINSADETKINGVTMEIYMLQRDVDANGIFKGSYSGTPQKMERYMYTIRNDDPNAELVKEPDILERYKTGTGDMRVVVDAGVKDAAGNDVSNILSVNQDYIPYTDGNNTFTTLKRYLSTNKDGKYAFVSLPEGDYFIRFRYGDTTDTVLMQNVDEINFITNAIGNNEVNELLARTTAVQQAEELGGRAEEGKGTGYEADKIYGSVGLNAKSYNGQDYKSTIYQTNINQYSNYYGINGYNSGSSSGYESQNYSTDTQDYLYVVGSDTNNNKNMMYYYDITASEAQQSSDAKDVWYYRQRANQYGTGETNNNGTQRNTLAEILSSFEKKATYTELASTEDGMKLAGSQRQWEMIKELINNTSMVAQTGIISTKGEHDTDETSWGSNDGQTYYDGLVNSNTAVDDKEAIGQWIKENIGDLDNIDISDVLSPEDIAEIEGWALEFEGGLSTQGSNYSLRNIDLGLQERPEAGLKLTKKISNFSLILANGQTLFNTDKTVRNLYLAEHQGHKTFFTTTETKPEDSTYGSVFNRIKSELKYVINGDIYDGDILRDEDDNLYKTDLFGNISANLEARRLAGVVTSANSSSTPELLQLYMDDELMEGAQIGVTYKFVVENVGEVDYLDKQFYYTGYTNDFSEGNVSKTNAKEIVDYVSNMIRYDQTYQNDKEDGTKVTWNAKTLAELTHSVDNGSGSGEYDVLNNVQIYDEYYHQAYTFDNLVDRKDVIVTYNGDGTIANIDYLGATRQDYVNRAYADIAKTYDTILMTEELQGDLLPIKYGYAINNPQSTETSLVLATQISSNNTGDNLVYNNLAEIVETTNTAGRRMQYSIIGNQRMADQSQGDDAIPGVSSEDLITPGALARDEVSPTEIDADSAQKIVITKPTGENRNYTPIILASIAALILIGSGAFLITKALRK